MNFILPLLIFVLVTVIVVPPVYAKVLTFDIDKHTFYVAGDTITFSGTSDTAYDIISIVIYEPPDDKGNKKLVTAKGTIAGSDKKFEESIQITSGVFKKHGIYSATAFLEKGQPFEEGLKVLFDFSVDGSPVVPSAYVIPIELKSINDLTTNEETKLAFTAALVNSYRGNETLSFSLGNNFPTGASIDPKSGAFSWTPTESQGPGSYTFDIVVKAGKAEDRETLTITVNEVADIPKVEPKPTPQPEPEPESNVPDFVDPKKGAQYYLDRYNNEKSYKVWFDTNFPDYTIEEAIELAIPGSISEPEPPKNIAPFVDPNQDPQYYIDRYNNEPSYKAWFDKSFPDQTIYEAVGVEPPKTGICGPGTNLVDGFCEAEVKNTGGGCLIATATFGSELSPQVQSLRELRDNTLLQTTSGSSFMNGFNQFYYLFSPTVADIERENPLFREAVKITITPMISSLSILNYVDIDSEQEVLVYGLGVILLNIGMYFALPTFTILTVKRNLYHKSSRN